MLWDGHSNAPRRGSGSLRAIHALPHTVADTVWVLSWLSRFAHARWCLFKWGRDASAQSPGHSGEEPVHRGEGQASRSLGI